MTNTIAMFPGQGSQYVGMGEKLLEAFPWTNAIFEEAEDASKVAIRRLCLDGPDEDLKLTANTQPCLLTVSVAYWEVLKRELGLSIQYFAGHSLGEYSALVAAGKLDLSRAAYLVRARGEAMQRAVPAGVGGMAAVMKMSVEALEALCLKHSHGSFSVEIANYNSDAQLVIAGHKEAVKSLAAEATTMGARCIELPVSAPFHSSLMNEARAQMLPLLRDTVFHKNENYVIPNISALEIKDYQPEFLIEQIDGPVRWIQSITQAQALGMTRFIEVGPGKVLSGLVKRIVPSDGSCEIFATDDITQALASLR
ncbi:MAG: [acyl-carrier-protein] S-malonyltransferase [Proteobacteria bacterium]|nr:MAG: [acyl-carrier-protein] S-malonyltransferase [Pseudomonadota bacterium]